MNGSINDDDPNEDVLIYVDANVKRLIELLLD